MSPGKSSTSDDHVFHLFVRPKDVKAEQWDGVRSGTQAALDVFNADEVCSQIYKGRNDTKGIQAGDVNEISSLLAPLVSDASKIYTDYAANFKGKSLVSRFLRDSSPKAEGLAKLLQSNTVLPLKDHINEVRNVKSDAEIANMRFAGQASGRAFTDSMRQAWTRERDLAAHLEYKFRTNDCDGSAYVPVVAGGKVVTSVVGLPSSVDYVRMPASSITSKIITSFGMSRSRELTLCSN